MNRSACHKCGCAAWMWRCTRCSKRFCDACYDEHLVTHEEPGGLFGFDEAPHGAQDEPQGPGQGDESEGGADAPQGL